MDPTLFVGVDNSMTIAREEIFGPVVAVIPYDDVDDAVAIANDSDYGLAGSVYGADVDEALDVARRVRTGTSTINGFLLDFASPFGTPSTLCPCTEMLPLESFWSPSTARARVVFPQPVLPINTP